MRGMALQDFEAETLRSPGEVIRSSLFLVSYCIWFLSRAAGWQQRPARHANCSVGRIVIVARVFRTNNASLSSRDVTRQR